MVKLNIGTQMKNYQQNIEIKNKLNANVGARHHYYNFFEKSHYYKYML